MPITLSDTIAPGKIDLTDLIDRKEALRILDISSKTLTNYICLGKIRVVSRNGNGKPFFSRREVYGIK